MADAMSVNHFPKVIYEERLADGSDTPTPAADHRAHFLGEDGAFYTKDSAGVVTPAGGTETLPESIIDADGDLIRGDAADSAVRLPRGADGQALRSTATSVAWEDDFYSIVLAIDGGGSAITTGRKLPIRVPMAGVIVEATALLDQSGSISVDIWKDTLANYPPLDADSITAAAPVAVAAATNSTDTTLTGWTTAVAAGDVLIPNVDSITTATWAVIVLRVRKT